MTWSADRKNRLLLALAGFNLILLNYTLIRQLTLAFRNLETSALLMALAYFAGISLGYLYSNRISPSTIRLMLPFFLVAQLVLISVAPVLVIRLVDGLTDRLGDSVGLNVAYFGVFILVMLCSTSLYSIFLPQMIQGEENSTQRYYTAEILGSIVGLLSLPLLGQFGMVGFYGVYLASFLGIALLVGVKPFALGALAVLSLVFLIGFDRIDKSISAMFYRQLYGSMGVQKVLYTRYSPYHKVEILVSESGDNVLVLNAHRQFAPSSHPNYSYFVAEYPARLLHKPTVALLGCGSMSTVGRMGDYVSSIQIVDLDRAVFETSRDFFPQYNRLAELKNWTFQSDDAKHFLAETKRSYDLIIDDIPPAKTRQIALTYTKEFFELVKARLAPGGLFSLNSLTALHSESEYGKRMLATLASVFDRVYVLNDGNNSYYYSAGQGTVFDRETLRQAIDHPHKDRIEILMPDEVRDLVEGVTTISVNNMADLILE